MELEVAFLAVKKCIGLVRDLPETHHDHPTPTLTSAESLRAGSTASFEPLGYRRNVSGRRVRRVY